MVRLTGSKEMVARVAEFYSYDVVTRCGGPDVASSWWRPQFVLEVQRKLLLPSRGRHVSSRPSQRNKTVLSVRSGVAPVQSPLS